MTVRSHPRCWQGDHYEHTTCIELSGRACIDCGKPAGTKWGFSWCPDCDVIRLDRISKSLEALLGDTP